eukprot:maker-scaffold78_size404448-snap-gene-3.29 protein:Tk10220 transcript:maker-scaffold78_size404448-snap-gene-3.29-mRNA-1 annotation:"microcephalin-like isoform x4"
MVVPETPERVGQLRRSNRRSSSQQTVDSSWTVSPDGGGGRPADLPARVHHPVFALGQPVESEATFVQWVGATQDLASTHCAAGQPASEAGDTTSSSLMALTQANLNDHLEAWAEPGPSAGLNDFSTESARDLIGQFEARGGLPASPASPAVPLSQLLRGVVACVEVRSHHENRSKHVQGELEKLGAQIVAHVNRRTTHLVFKDGSLATYNQAKRRGCFIVSVTWVLTCRERGRREAEAAFPSVSCDKYDSPGLFPKLRKAKSMQPKSDAEMKRLIEARFQRRERERLKQAPLASPDLTPAGGPPRIPRLERSQDRDDVFNILDALPSPLTLMSPPSRALRRSQTPVSVSSPCSSEDFDTPLARRLVKKYFHTGGTPPSVPRRGVKPFNLSARIDRTPLGLLSSNPGLDTPGSDPNQSLSAVVRSLHLSRASSPSMDLEGGQAQPTACSPPRPAGGLLTPPALPASLCLTTQAVETSDTLVDAPLALPDSLCLPTQAVETSDTLVDPPRSQLFPPAQPLKPIKRPRRSSRLHTPRLVELVQPVTRQTKAPPVSHTIPKKRHQLFSQNALLSETPVTSPLQPIVENIHAQLAPKEAPKGRTKIIRDHCLLIAQPPVIKPKLLVQEAPAVRKKAQRVKARQDPSSNTSSETLRAACRRIIPSRRSSVEFAKPKQKGSQKALKDSIRDIVCTAVGEEEEDLARQVVKKLGKYALAKSVTESTSHIVVGEPATRTLELLQGILRGCWIVSFQWILDCLEFGFHVDEEPFEMVHFSPAIPQCRIDRQAFGIKVYKSDLFAFSGTICIYGISKHIPIQDLKALIILGGGSLVKLARLADLVISHGRPISHEEEDSQVFLNENWILDSIQRHKIQPFDLYRH